MKVAKQGPKAFSADYTRVLQDIKTRIHAAQVKAAFAANQEMILLYWDVGRMISERQKQAGWGAAVIPRLSRDIRNELPEVKGFSERNIKLMTQFFREYSDRTMFCLCKRSKICQYALGTCKLRFNTDGVVMCWL